VLLTYFGWSSLAAAWMRGVDGVGPVLIDLAVVAAWAVADSQPRSGTRWRSVRPWLLLALVPLAYWQADLINVSPPHGPYERAWIALDVRILRDWRLQDAIEAWGVTLPFILELTYACVYAAPPVVVAYVQRRYDGLAVERFLQAFLVGTFAAYAVLPLFPSSSPRIAFPNAVPPPTDSAVRHFNLWILKHLDVAVSVFPSGHVAATWSVALGAASAIRDRRNIPFLLCGFAVLTSIATVYGRYHYLADVIAGTAVAGTAIGVLLLASRQNR